MNEQVVVTANVDVYTVEVDGSRTLVGQGRNRVVTGGLSALPEMLRASSGNPYTQGLRYTEVGAGAGAGSTKAVVAGDTKLEDPKVRGEIRKEDARSTGALLATETFFVSTAVSFHLSEAGLWVGDVATTELGTGTLFARTTLNVDNSVARKDIVLAWRINFAARAAPAP